MFASFRRRHGYDLRPRLEAVFSNRECPHEMKVRLDYREWISRRFEEAWVKPVARWCRSRGVALIGHFSPEEDPINQASCIGNLFPLQKHMSWAGFDIIIPAVGDQRHPLLNVSAVSALSAAQQNRQPGVCCESLGASGPDITPYQIARILAWQVLNGVNLAVLHAGFHSQMGLRRLEAPPDYGPNSPLWESIQTMHKELASFLRITLRATQEAPVAILWPIRSFQLNGTRREEEVLRDDLLKLLLHCLESQVGVHLLDEEDFLRAKSKDGRITVGRASYSCLLVPSARIYLAETLSKLAKVQSEGIRVMGAGKPPAWAVQRKSGHIRPPDKMPWPHHDLGDFCKNVDLPRLLSLPDKDRKHFRASIWKRGRSRNLLLMHLDDQCRSVSVSDIAVDFSPGELIHFVERQGHWKIEGRFSPSAWSSCQAEAESVTFGPWKMDIPGTQSCEAAYPLGAWQLISHGGERPLAMALTQPMLIGGGKIADSITYRVKASFAENSRNALLWVEPTLMRGRFTLQAGGKEWRFQVSDTDTVVKKIDLSSVRKNGSLDLTFVLHQPEAPDGIKHHPHIEV